MKILLALAFVGCTFPARSAEFACQTTADCDVGRVCDHGFCVERAPDLDASPLDASPAPDGPVTPDAPACTATGLTCAGETTVITCGDACWIACADPVAQPAVRARCMAWGGEPTPLRTSIDAACFGMVQRPESMWLGLIQASMASSVATGWSWNGDGLIPPFTTWASDEPNDSDDDEDGDEQCAFVNVADTWQDKSCATAYAFACRR